MSIVFKAPARFAADEIRKLRPEFDLLAASGDDVVFDLARTEEIDGSGVGALVFTFKRLAANGSRLTIRNISGQPLELLNATDLLRTLGREPADGMFRSTIRKLGLLPPRQVAASPAVPVASGERPARQDIERAKGAA
jgi:anti-sigma B factor antagonist